MSDFGIGRAVRTAHLCAERSPGQLYALHQPFKQLPQPLPRAGMAVQDVRQRFSVTAIGIVVAFVISLARPPNH